MHIQIMRIKVSTEAAFTRLCENSRLGSPVRVASYMLDQIDRWMMDGYRKPRTMSDMLDNRRHAILAKGLKK